MVNYIARRLVWALLVVWGVVTAVFVLVRVLPGDPATMMVGAQGTLQEVETVRHQLGLDRPLYVQYLLFLREAATGDFGDSLYYGEPSVQLVVERIPRTIELAVPTVIISTALAIPLGIIAALHANSVLDKVVSSGTLIAQSMPNFWVGIMLVLVFGRDLKLLPTSGYGTWKHLVMPLATLVLPQLAFLARLVRSGMLDNLGSDYVRTARSKGFSGSRVVRRHVLPNLMIPIVTLVGLRIGYLLGGVVIIETVFAWPGVGRLLLDSIRQRDFPVLQACILFIALTYVLVNLAVDITYAYLDPRIRYDRPRR